MRKVGLTVVVALSAALLGSATTAGGILCMLYERDVTIGKLTSGPQDGLCQVEAAGLLGLAKIRRREEFLEADDLRPPACRLSNQGLGAGQILFGVGAGVVLDDADGKRARRHRPSVRGSPTFRDVP